MDRMRVLVSDLPATDNRYTKHSFQRSEIRRLGQTISK